MTSSDLSWIAILIAGISASGVIGSFLLNWRIATKENDRKYAELISKYIRELDELQIKRVMLKDKPKREIIVHISLELNKVDEIIFLNSKGKIPFDLTMYFQQWIEEAYTMLKGIHGKSFEKLVINKIHWKRIITWCEEHNIQKTSYMPTPLISLLDKWDSTDNQQAKEST